MNEIETELNVIWRLRLVRNYDQLIQLSDVFQLLYYEDLVTNCIIDIGLTNEPIYKSVESVTDNGVKGRIKDEPDPVHRTVNID